jgi:hypothetical protein
LENTAFFCCDPLCHPIFNRVSRGDGGQKPVIPSSFKIVLFRALKCLKKLPAEGRFYRLCVKGICPFHVEPLQVNNQDKRCFSTTKSVILCSKGLTMKKRKKVVVSVILIALTLLCGIGLIMSIFFKVDTVGYTVLEKQGKFELRQYPSCLIAETVVDADFKEAGNVAFGRLFKYISGHNRKQESISMTAPVSQAGISEKIAMTAPVNMQQAEGKYAVSFVMPSKYTLGTLPEPLDETVVIKEIPVQKIAAIRYSGTWSQERYEAKKASLEEFLQAKGLVSTGEPVFARYDPPFQVWFLRRNEVLIPVE